MASTDNRISRRLQSIKQIIIVLSGKGGVGKSSVSAQLALNLYLSSPTARIGILDIDLTGPSIPRMLGLDGHAVHQSSDGWVPVFADGSKGRLGCMSVGFLLKNRGDSVVWRGPKKNGMIRQFLSDVRWGELDYLVIDTPPGTSDEHLSLLEHLSSTQSQSQSHPKLSSIIVTTPQAVALSDALKCLSFARTVNLPILGLIENMSGYVCPCCGEVSNVFSTGGGEAMAQREGLRFLGNLPVDTELVTLLDASESESEGDGGASSLKDDAPALAEAEDPEPDAQDIPTTLPAPSSSSSSSSSFPLLDRYKSTSSSKLFETILERALDSLHHPVGVVDSDPTG